jgi:hypothetical protein
LKILVWARDGFCSLVQTAWDSPDQMSLEFPARAPCITISARGRTPACGTCLQRELYEEARRKAARSACPSVGNHGRTIGEDNETGGVPGFDAHRWVKGRKRHILVDTTGLPIACRVEPANISDRRAASLPLDGLGPLFPDIRTVIADAGHESRKLARQIMRGGGWKVPWGCTCRLGREARRVMQTKRNQKPLAEVLPFPATKMDRFIIDVASHHMSGKEPEEQRRSFAYGSLHLTIHVSLAP